MSGKIYCFEIQNVKNLDETAIQEDKLSYQNFFDSKNMKVRVLYDSKNERLCIQPRTKSKDVAKAMKEFIRGMNSDGSHSFERLQLGSMYSVQPTTVKWWEEEDKGNFEIKRGDQLWKKTFRHNGLFFPHIEKPFESLGAPILYKGEPLDLSNDEEEVMILWPKRTIVDMKDTIKIKHTLECKRGGDSHATFDYVFHKNFYTDLIEFLNYGLKQKLVKKLSELQNEPRYNKFFVALKDKKIKFPTEMVDFMSLDYKHIIEKIQLNTSRDVSKMTKKHIRSTYGGTAQEKLLMAKDSVREMKAIERSENILKYKYVEIDGALQEVGQYAVQPMRIFLGRGEHPNRGRIVKHVYPHNVVLNLDPEAVLPPNPPNFIGEGYQREVNMTTMNIAKYKANSWMRATNVRLAIGSNIDSQRMAYKFEKARKLDHNIQTVRSIYSKDLTSDSIKLRQLSTVLYLIDNYGIRVGGEKDTDEAQTFGASSLLVSHLNFLSEERVNFDFEGKDSIRYNKELKFPTNIYENLKSFTKKGTENKGLTEQLFDEITPEDINGYLQKIDGSFSAKVFRTRLASSIMFETLENLDLTKDIQRIEGDVSIKTAKARESTIKNFVKKRFQKEANIKVATVLNHISNLTEKQKQKIEKMKTDIASMREGHALLSGAAKGAVTTKINKLEEDLEYLQTTSMVALGTSLKNYIDPRIIINWCQRHDINSTILYSSSLLTQFKWARFMLKELTTDEDEEDEAGNGEDLSAEGEEQEEWLYPTTPLLIEEDLKPADPSTISRSRGSGSGSGKTGSTRVSKQEKKSVTKVEIDSLQKRLKELEMGKKEDKNPLREAEKSSKTVVRSNKITVKNIKAFLNPPISITNSHFDSIPPILLRLGYFKSMYVLENGGVLREYGKKIQSYCEEKNIISPNEKQMSIERQDYSIFTEYGNIIVARDKKVYFYTNKWNSFHPTLAVSTESENLYLLSSSQTPRSFLDWLRGVKRGENGEKSKLYYSVTIFRNGFNAEEFDFVDSDVLVYVTGLQDFRFKNSEGGFVKLGETKVGHRKIKIYPFDIVFSDTFEDQKRKLKYAVKTSDSSLFISSNLFNKIYEDSSPVLHKDISNATEKNSIWSFTNSADSIKYYFPSSMLSQVSTESYQRYLAKVVKGRGMSAKYDFEVFFYDTEKNVSSYSYRTKEMVEITIPSKPETSPSPPSEEQKKVDIPKRPIGAKELYRQDILKELTARGTAIEDIDPATIAVVIDREWNKKGEKAVKKNKYEAQRVINVIAYCKDMRRLYHEATIPAQKEEIKRKLENTCKNY